MKFSSTNLKKNKDNLCIICYNIVENVVTIIPPVYMCKNCGFKSQNFTQANSI
ncbi:MAG: hypothetical protein J5930_00355 [Treponema sp.]|jgi:hypothetical protein|nr:hypothetical protein [Treponema sp.]